MKDTCFNPEFKIIYRHYSHHGVMLTIHNLEYHNHSLSSCGEGGGERWEVEGTSM